jgi:predicted alpha/beta superfamily hydrolase
MLKLIYFLACIRCFPVNAFDYKTDTLVLASLILNEPRDVVVYEPEGLGAKDSVILVYLLDGESAKYRYERILSEQYDRPVVGIGIINTNRNRDMLPPKQPGKFLEFIDKELIPAMEKNYVAVRKILFGHSFAGGFTIYAMIQKPGLFDRYIASSPTPIMNMVDAGTYLQMDKQLLQPVAFYFTSGSKDMKQVKKWCGILNNNLQTLQFTNLHWRNEVNNGENHNTNDVITLIKGMR